MTDPSQYHAYTDGTDTIIGTSLQEAVRAYAAENPDATCLLDTIHQFEELGDGQQKTIRVEPAGNREMYRETKTYREWIDEQIAANPNNFSRLLCSTEY